MHLLLVSFTYIIWIVMMVVMHDCIINVLLLWDFDIDIHVYVYILLIDCRLNVFIVLKTLLAIRQSWLGAHLLLVPFSLCISLLLTLSITCSYFLANFVKRHVVLSKLGLLKDNPWWVYSLENLVVARRFLPAPFPALIHRNMLVVNDAIIRLREDLMRHLQRLLVNEATTWGYWWVKHHLIFVTIAFLSLQLKIKVCPSLLR